MFVVFVSGKHIGIARGGVAKPSALVCFYQRKRESIYYKSLSFLKRLSRVTNALALKGYNVTVLSPDIEQNAVANLHYLHLDKVYDRLYNSDDMDMNLLDFGKLSPWFHFGPLFEYYWNTCEGAVVSSGWKQLRDYPSDFKVFKNYFFIFGHINIKIVR